MKTEGFYTGTNSSYALITSTSMFKEIACPYYFHPLDKLYSLLIGSYIPEIRIRVQAQIRIAGSSQLADQDCPVGFRPYERRPTQYKVTCMWV
jgi:hypothetical protein